MQICRVLTFLFSGAGYPSLETTKVSAYTVFFGSRNRLNSISRSSHITLGIDIHIHHHQAFSKKYSILRQMTTNVNGQTEQLQTVLLVARSPSAAERPRRTETEADNNM